VIIPTYEAWPNLRRTLLSVLRDVRDLDVPWQLLVVDNESAPSLARDVARLGRSGEALEVVRRTRLDGSYFQPGAARNIGIERARHDCLVFLDADCVPAEGTLRRYLQLVSEDRQGVFIGHRVFISADELDAEAVAHQRDLLHERPQVHSVSNYGALYDRRLVELRNLEEHPRPYDCLFGCNFALHRSCLGELRFHYLYDGFWGYEDIDLGWQLHEAGRRFKYIPEAYVFHQEGTQVSVSDRVSGRLRNLALFERRCPGFIAYRAKSSRPGALPDGMGELDVGGTPASEALRLVSAIT
jgi:GT2 family glycosyltransferase